ncbi:MAG TPA: kinase/pyrophosphorylase [Nitrospirae bacterium]|nr:kinase/pyrophosphorylase [Nitrospirota bacterium]
MAAAKKQIYVFIVSDATGTTAEAVINAALVQFRDIKPVYKKFPYIKTKEHVEEILTKAAEVGGIVIYSIVSEELRAWFRLKKQELNIYAIDLLGPIINRISKLCNSIPILQPGLFRGISEYSLRLAESIDFTLKHDDGQEIQTIDRADLIILGVSRTSKTPTSIYLACNYGLRVANVPIVLKVPLPERVSKTKKPKIGFTITPERLAFIRRRRMKYLKSEIDYSDIEYIREEINYSNRIFNTLDGIEVIDITHNSIEETAQRIVEVLNNMKGRHRRQFSHERG